MHFKNSDREASTTIYTPWKLVGQRVICQIHHEIHEAGGIFAFKISGWLGAQPYQLSWMVLEGMSIFPPQWHHPTYQINWMFFWNIWMSYFRTIFYASIFPCFCLQLYKYTQPAVQSILMAILPNKNYKRTLYTLKNWRFIPTLRFATSCPWHTSCRNHKTNHLSHAK